MNYMDKDVHCNLCGLTIVGSDNAYANIMARYETPSLIKFNSDWAHEQCLKKCGLWIEGGIQQTAI